MSTRPDRSAAEWTTFVVSALLVAGLVGLIIVQASREDLPPAPSVRVSGPIEQLAGRFHVPVSVINEGDEAAEAVQVVATLEIGSETIEGDQTIDFLSGRDEAELVFVFNENPGTGKLTLRVTGFTVP